MKISNLTTKLAISAFGSIAGGSLICLNKDSDSDVGTSIGSAIMGVSLACGIFAFADGKSAKAKETALRSRINLGGDEQPQNNVILEKAEASASAESSIGTLVVNAASPQVLSTGFTRRNEFKRTSGTIGDLISNVKGADDTLAMQSMYELMCRYLQDGQVLREEVSLDIAQSLYLDEFSQTSPRLVGFIKGLDKFKPGFADLPKHVQNRRNLLLINKQVEDNSPSNSPHTDRGKISENFSLARKALTTKVAILRNQVRSPMNHNHGHVKIRRKQGRRRELLADIRNQKPVDGMESMHELVLRFVVDGQKLDDRTAFLILQALLLEADRREELLVRDELSLGTTNTNISDPNSLAFPLYEGFVKAIDKAEAFSGNEEKNLQVRINLAKLGAMSVKMMTGFQESNIPEVTEAEEFNNKRLSTMRLRCLGAAETALEHRHGQIGMRRRQLERQSSAEAISI